MTTALLTVAPLASVQFGATLLEAYCIAAGLALTYWVNPDLDLNYAARDPLHLYFYPYSRRFHHRSFWSHFPVVSTLIRLAYLGWPLLFLSPDWNLVGHFFAGMALSDAFHWVLDWPLWHTLDNRQD